jgi:hypothetical protein
MKGKRGQAILSSLIYTAVELAIVAMFIAAVLVKVNSSVADDTYQKRFYARDLALLTDSMMAAEGTFQLEHEIVTQKPLDIDIQLKIGSIAVKDHTNDPDEIPSETSFLFGTNPSVKITPSVSTQATANSYETKNGHVRAVVLRKQDSTIYITEPNKVVKAGDVEGK